MVQDAFSRQIRRLSPAAFDGTGNDLTLGLGGVATGQEVTVWVGPQGALRPVGTFSNTGGDALWSVSVDIHEANIPVAEYVAVTSDEPLTILSAFVLYPSSTNLASYQRFPAIASVEPVFEAPDYDNVAKLYRWDWDQLCYVPLPETDWLNPNVIDWTHPTIILTHGWNSSLETATFISDFAKDFMAGREADYQTFNILAVDWYNDGLGNGSDPNDTITLLDSLNIGDAQKSATNGIEAATVLAGRLISVVGAAGKLHPEEMMLIGHSNGAGFMASMALTLKAAGHSVAELVALDAPTITASWGEVLSAAGEGIPTENYYMPLAAPLGFGQCMFLLGEEILNFSLDTTASWVDGVVNIGHLIVPARYAKTADAENHVFPWGFQTSAFINGGESLFDAFPFWQEKTIPGHFVPEISPELTEGGLIMATETAFDVVVETAKSIWDTGVLVADGLADALKGLNTSLLVSGGLMSIYALANSPVYASVDVIIPSNADLLEFDLSVLDPGNNDHLLVMIGDDVVEDIDLASVQLVGGVREEVWIQGYAGESTTVTFYMPSDVPSSAEFLLSNIQFVDVNFPPVAFVDPGSMLVGPSTTTFAVTFIDPEGSLFSSTIDGNDILVTGPNGFSQLAELMSADQSGDGSTCIATYRITAPDTTWTAADSGTYTAWMQPEQVSDIDGNYVASGVLGTFTVNAGPDAIPPAAGLSDPVSGGSIMLSTLNTRGYIDVTFSDIGGSGLNASTITDSAQEFTLSGTAASGVTINGSPVLVSGTTYRYSFTGSFSTGVVGVNFAGGSFADDAGNPNSVASEGFTVIPNPDTTPPNPNPSQWATSPYATGTTSISMTAAVATDPEGNGVQYSFHCLTAGGHDSGWQARVTYEDTGLLPSVTYTYEVRTRDQSPNQNEGSCSVSASATTQSLEKPPTIATLEATPDFVARGDRFALVAFGVTDSDGSVVSVAFYRETNGTPGLQTGASGDRLLGIDDNGSDGWAITFDMEVTSDGSYTYYARATDNEGATSADGTSATSVINTVDGVRLFFDDFPSTMLNTSNWPGGQLWTIDSFGRSESSGPYSLRLNGTDEVASKTIDLSDITGATLCYWYERKRSDLETDPNDDLALEYWNGSAWVELKRHAALTQDMINYSEVQVKLPVDALHADFRFRFRVTSESYSDWLIDDVRLVGWAPSDIQLQSVTADGGTGLSITYLVNGAAVDPFDINFYRSANATYEARDQLLTTIHIQTAADLTPGLHTKTLAMGDEVGQVRVPGVGSADSDAEYYLLAVADPVNIIAEADSNPWSEDNTVVFHGVYHTAGGKVYVHGTSGNDTVSITPGSIRVGLNDTVYTYADTDVSAIRIWTYAGDDTIDATAANAPVWASAGDGDDQLNASIGDFTLYGGAGNDTALLQGSNQAENARIWPGKARFMRDTLNLWVYDTETITAQGGGGADTARLFDSSGSDTFTSDRHSASMVGEGFSNTVEGFRYVYGASESGDDTAYLYDSDQRDVLQADPINVALSGAGFFNRATRFRFVYAYGNNGATDTATLTGSADADQWDAAVGSTRLFDLAGTYDITAEGFDDRQSLRAAMGPTRPDCLRLLVERYTCGLARPGGIHRPWAGQLGLWLSDCRRVLQRWRTIRRSFTDSKGNDKFSATPTSAVMSGDGYSLNADHFKNVNRLATAGGSDSAYLYDSVVDDTYRADGAEGRKFYGNGSFAPGQLL